MHCEIPTCLKKVVEIIGGIRGGVWSIRLRVGVLRIRVLQTAAIGVTAGLRERPPLQVLGREVRPHGEEVARAELAIQVAAATSLKARGSYIPIAASCRPLQLIEVYTAVIKVRPLRPANRGGIPIAAREEAPAVIVILILLVIVLVILIVVVLVLVKLMVIMEILLAVVVVVVIVIVIVILIKKKQNQVASAIPRGLASRCSRDANPRGMAQHKKQKKK